MAKGRFNNIKIGGICVTLPVDEFTTEELAKNMDERSLRRFIKATGVEKRFLSKEKQTTSDLCYVAAEKLLEQNQIKRGEIDAVIFVSQNTDYKRPSTAIIMQERLGLSTSCLAFDINLGCSGYVYGLYVLAGLIEGGAVKKALLLTGDVNKDLPDELLFGDGASATLLEQGDGIIEGIMKSDGSGYKAIYTPVGGQRCPLNPDNPAWNDYMPKMNGTDVFEFTITQVPQLLDEFMKEFQHDYDDYDYVILHQANLMMLKHIVQKAGISMDKVPISIHKYGNVSSASIPIAIADLCMELNNQNSKLQLLLSGFGVGLSLGIVSIELEPDAVLPIIFSDYVWDGNFPKETT